MQGDKKKGIAHVSTTCMGWDPKTGENKVFDTPEARAEAGWLDHHPQDEEKGGAGRRDRRTDTDDAVPPLSREELIAALNTGKVKYNESATDKQLDNALRGALIQALTAANREFDKKAPTRKLLELVTGGTAPKE